MDKQTESQVPWNYDFAILRNLPFLRSKAVNFSLVTGWEPRSQPKASWGDCRAGIGTFPEACLVIELPR
jgi:hypothetical protein